MEPLTLKQRIPVETPDVENWDDDDFGDDLEDVQFRTASTATSVISHPQAAHRDSVSSRMSLRSDSNQGDENWDVLVDEQASIKDAVALAKSKGIPLPTNIPRSALEGGTIRRLKGKEIKKAIADDWSEDLDLPGTGIPLKLAKHEDRDLSGSLRQISAAFRTSPKTPDTKEILDQTIRSPKSRTSAMPITLDAFRDTDEDANFGDVPTIRVAKHRSPQKPMLFQQPPTPVKPETENLEEDLELPSDGQLRLSTRKPLPSTPQQNDDFDLEWAEGSLGTRNAGRNRGGRSARSSSASAFSPSVSSAFTGESEDEGLDGLVLPDGPIQFKDKLNLRQQEGSLDPPPRSVPDVKAEVRKVSGKDDFFSGLEIGDGEVFDTAKLTLNRNVKHKSTRATSPSKRATTTLNFTSTKTQSTISRLPRFQPSHDRHERARSNLEPVSETGAAISSYQRPNSRLGHHAAQSASSIPAPQPPSAPSTPSKRLLRGTESQRDLRFEPPTTTNSQLLRTKRSMPVMRGVNSPTKASPYVRPPSRQDTGSRLNIPSRPRTPTDRDRFESRFGHPHKAGGPFLPAGASAGQSQHVSIKTHYRGQGSDGSSESMSAAQRSLSRLAGLGRPETPGRGIDSRGRNNLTPLELAAQAKKTITKPTKRRNYGDGSELEIFDDLPTSATLESKFTKLPIGRGAPRSLRSKLGLSHLNPSTSSLSSTRRGSETPVPSTPLTPASRSDFPTTALNTTSVPRFARDTAASRNAREQRQISGVFQNMRGEPLQPISTNWKFGSSAIKPSNQGSLRKKKSDKIQLKPHLIKPMGGDLNRPKTEKGMSYNPLLFTWEGNENDLEPFDVPDFYPESAVPVMAVVGVPNSKAQVALISNVGANVTGVQVVGGMVFDPSQMRWLKIAENADGSVSGLRGGSVQVEEEDDVFAGLEDLKEEDETRSRSGTLQNISSVNQSRESFGEGEGAHSSGDEFGLGVSEEFDVGPEFVRRQRGEEDRWRRKVEKWLRKGGEAEEEEDFDGRGGWRWSLRDLVMQQG